MGLGSKVLVATDLSEGGDEAIVQAYARATAEKGELVVCHVVSNVLRNHPFFPELGVEETTRLLAAEKRAAEAVRERVATLTGHEDGSGSGSGNGGVRVVIDNGLPDTAILRIADEEKATLVVVGSTGTTGLARVLLGNVAARIVRYAHCPVLVTRRHERTNRIVAATDLSDPSLAAVAAAAEEGRVRGAKVTLLHSIDIIPSSVVVGLGTPFGATWVVPPPELVEEVRASAVKALADLIAQYAIDGEPLATEGDAAIEIIRAAEARRADLVIVATRGRTGLTRMVLGSTAERVLEQAHCSVLAVRHAP